MTIDVTSLGPASLAFPVVGAALSSDSLYVVSRNLVPTRLGALDLSAGTARVVADVPTGGGAWGVVTVDDQLLYLGQLGAQGEGNLYRYTIAAQALEAVAAIDAHHIWGLAADGDGTVYGVSAPPLVFSYDPATGSARDLGVIDKSTDSPRSVAATTARLYVGASRNGRALLLSAELDGGGVAPVLPDELAEHQVIYSLATDGRLLAAGTRGPAGQPAAVALLDAGSGAPQRVITLPGTEVVDALLVDGDAVIASTRPDGAIVRIIAASGAVEPLGTPVPNAETRGLFRYGRAVVGASATERAWRYEDGAFTTLDLVAAGLEPGPERAQSITVREGEVAVGGNFGVQLHGGEGAASQRVFAPGEPKAMAYVDERLWLAMYPTGELWSLDPDGEARRAAAFPAEQNRPVSLVHDPDGGLLLVGTASDRAGGGALGIYTLATESFDVVVNPHRAGHVAGIAVSGGTAFLGGSGEDPTIAAFDLAARRVVWEVELPGAHTLIGVAVARGRVHALSGTGHHAVVEVGSQTVEHRADLPGAGGQLVLAGERLYGVGKDALYAIDTTSFAATRLVDGLGALVWGWPQLAADEAGRLYLIRGTDLVRADPAPAPART